MQFDRDEFLLLSRRGSVPIRSKGPPSEPRLTLRQPRTHGLARRLRSLCEAVVSAITISRRAARGSAGGYRRDR
jgi:hypothetical protein